MRDKSLGGRSGRGLRKRRGFFSTIIVVAAAALLYYGAVWLVTERVKTMPEGPPPDDGAPGRPHVEQMKNK